MPPKKKRVGNEHAVHADAAPDGTRRPGKQESGKESWKESGKKPGKESGKKPVKEEPGKKVAAATRGEGATGGRVGSAGDARSGEKKGKTSSPEECNDEFKRNHKSSVGHKVLFPYGQFLKLYALDDRFNDALKPCGLKNAGNSCFANVVLQCLSHTPPLVAYLLRKNHARLCFLKRNGDWCFLCELQTLIETAAGKTPFAPLSILGHLPQMGGKLCIGEQEDAHEYMRFAIDEMQAAFLEEFGGEKAVDLKTQRTTIIHYIFGGQLQSQVRCAECENVSNSYEYILDLSVEINGNGNVGSLVECLNQFTALEVLDGDNKYSCGICNDHVKAQKKLTVHRAPNILTITLKRFQSGRFGKINKGIYFPMKLDLTPYMSTTDGTDKYNLYAVVVHLDRLNDSLSGHYVCYIKNHEGQWVKIDDSEVMPVDEKEVLAQCAYMLLYSRTAAAAVEAAFGAGAACVPDACVPDAGLGGRAGRSGDAYLQDVAGCSKDAVVDGASNGRPKIADFSAKSGKKPKKDGAGDPQKKEDGPKENTERGTAAVEAGSCGEPAGDTTKLSRKALRLQRKADNSFRLEPHCGPIVDDEINFIEGNETKPKKVKNAKIGRREGGPLEQKEDCEKDKLDPQVLRLIRELCREYSKNVQQPKKTGKKDSRRGGGDWLEVEIKPTKDADATKVALDLCELYDATVKVVTHHNSQQETVADSPIRISWRPTADDLIRYSDEVLELFKLCSPFSFTVQLSDGFTREVPVTSAKPVDFEDNTYYIVALVGDEDRAEVHLLIDLFSNYLDAFRIVLHDEIADTKPWLILGEDNKLPKHFELFKNLKCDEGYGHLSEVYLHKDRIPELFTFFLSYDVPSPEGKHASYDDKILLNTSFVCFCEINRLGVMKSWVLDGVTREREHYLKLPRGYPALVRDWTYLGKLIFQLQLALLEEHMLESLPVEQRKRSPFSGTMSSVRDAWKKRQGIQQAITFFFEDKDEMKLNWLCGEHVTMLRHDYVLCNKVLMRFLGYQGCWLKDILGEFEMMEQERVKMMEQERRLKDILGEFEMMEQERVKMMEQERMLEDAPGDGEDAPADGEDASSGLEGTSDG